MPLYTLLMCKSSSLQDSCTTTVVASTMNFMYSHCRLTVQKRYFNKGYTGGCYVKWNLEEHQILSKSASNLPDGLECWTAVSGLPRQLVLKVQRPLQYLYFSSASDVFPVPFWSDAALYAGPAPGIFPAAGYNPYFRCGSFSVHTCGEHGREISNWSNDELHLETWWHTQFSKKSGYASWERASPFFKLYIIFASVHCPQYQEGMPPEQRSIHGKSFALGLTEQDLTFLTYLPHGGSLGFRPRACHILAPHGTHQCAL